MHGYHNHKSKQDESGRRATLNLLGTALPEFPTGNIDSTISLVYAPVVYGDAGDDERDDDQSLQGLGDNSPAEEEQANATEDNGCGDPGAVGTFQQWFTDTEDDQAENGEEVEGVSGYTVESDEGAELADDDVDGSQGAVKSHGIDRREAKSGIIAEETGEGLAGPGAATQSAACWRALRGGGVETDAAEYRGEIAFLAGCID